jgi:hypothetical protein
MFFAVLSPIVIVLHLFICCESSALGHIDGNIIILYSLINMSSF